ncbi:hypothetical protein GGR57DRAFT_479626 [Xylariaceae sp. FL1272]|nr:hypothetical protein GGR57DRAFT_479626 [Xylariaceae sp. FL1272]
MANQPSIEGTLRILEKGREMFANEAKRGDDNTLWDTMGSCIRGLTRRMVKPEAGDRPMEATAAELHNIWYIFTLSASNIDADHPAQDRLVRIVLWARELGAICGPDGTSMNSAAVTPGGKLWSDLPFLHEDLRDAWTHITSSTASSAPVEARNLAAAIARLDGLGVCDDKLTGCGSDIMRRALEEGSSGQLTHAQLLAMVEVWLRYAGDKLLAAASRGVTINDGWNTTGPPSTQQSTLSRNTVLTWMERLSELKASESQDVKVVAERCFNMLDWCCVTRWEKGIEAWASNE